MKRREFITLLGGAAAWPLAARAQQVDRVRRIGVLLPATADDPEFQARVGAFLQGLQQSGWTIGRNVRIDTRWATTSAADIRRHAAEFAALAPDVMLASGAAAPAAVQQTSPTIPATVRRRYLWHMSEKCHPGAAPRRQTRGRDQGGHRRAANLRLPTCPRHPQAPSAGRWLEAAQSQAGLPGDEGPRPAD
jgi:hypothetical protein